MKHLKDNPDAGFTLIEVVVALVMIFFFTNVALQMFVLSSVFKKKAVQYTTATNLIQQDMEKIKSAADQYSFPTISAATTATTVTLNSLNGFPSTNTTTDELIFSNSSDIYTISAINQSTKTITISPALKTTTTTTAAAAAVGATTVTLSSTTRLAANNQVKFSNNFTNTYTISSISNYDVTISPALTTSTPALTGLYIAPTSPINSTSCNSSASSSGMATYFINYLLANLNTSMCTTNSVADSCINPITNTNNSSAGYAVGTTYSAVTGTPTQVKGQYYWLLRKQEVSTDAPYNVLKLSYVVQPGLNDDPSTVIVENPSTTPNTATASTLAKSYTEVIPYASTQCPSQ